MCAVAYWLQQQTYFSARPLKLVHIVQSTASPLPERFKVVCIPCKALYKCSAFPLPFSLPYSIFYCRAINMTRFPYSRCNL